MELSNSRLTTNEDILNEFDPYSSRSSDQSFMENNFEIDCNFESQNLCKTNCKSKPQEYENCWLNMTGSDILSDISVHKLSQILLGEFRRLTKELQFTKRYHMCAYIKT